MKKLDTFTKIEDFFYYTWIFFSVVVFPVVGIKVIDSLFTGSFEWFIRYPVNILVFFVFCVVGYFLLFSVSASLEELFNRIRKRLGKRTSYEIHKEIRDEQWGLGREREEKEVQRFRNKSVDEKLDTLWALQNSNRNYQKIEIQKFWSVAIIIVIALFFLAAYLSIFSI